MSMAAVIFALLFIVAPVILLLEPPELTLLEFEEAVFTCTATGIPRPTITWYIVESSGSRSDASKLNGIAVTTMDSGESGVFSVLTISMAQASNAGVFACNALNLVNVDEENFNLTILGKLVTTY